MSEIELRDAILRHSLQLQRLSAGEAAKAEAILRELERELRMLLASQNLSASTKAELASLIRDAEKAISSRYATISVDTHALAIIVAEKTAEAMEDVFPINVLRPTPERLASLTRNVLIEGSPLSEWWKAQEGNTARRFAAQVRQGVIAGETSEKIVRRVVTEVMPIARRHARTLVHSSVMASANEARLATYRKNSRLIAGVRWLATLDSHTCKQCAALDGQAWDLDAKPLKGTTVSFIAPPAHASCRCVASPIPKSFRDLGLDIDEPAAGTRASSEGPISATTTFSDFLKRQSPAFVAKTLGKRRAELFASGKLTLRDLISGSGRELTLDELERHI